MTDRSLLPSSATAQERALSLAVSRAGDVPAPLRELWNPDTCPADKLAWLAWAFGVDEWSESWPEEAKRASIRDAHLVQRRKGTVWSMRRALRNAGLGSAQLLEGLSSGTYSGAYTYDATVTHGDPSQWAIYRAVLDQPMTNSQAAQVRRILNNTAPARCLLAELDFSAVTNTYDGALTYSGEFNHGTA
jgi:phage tail P2-like protein